MLQNTSKVLQNTSKVVQTLSQHVLAPPEHFGEIKKISNHTSIFLIGAKSSVIIVHLYPIKTQMSVCPLSVLEAWVPPMSLFIFYIFYFIFLFKLKK